MLTRTHAPQRYWAIIVQNTEASQPISAAMEAHLPYKTTSLQNLSQGRQDRAPCWLIPDREFSAQWLIVDETGGTSDRSRSMGCHTPSRMNMAPGGKESLPERSGNWWTRSRCVSADTRAVPADFGFLRGLMRRIGAGRSYSRHFVRYDYGEATAFLVKREGGEMNNLPFTEDNPELGNSIFGQGL
ncbi:hypothetical protein V495_06767 [Pseudogymnoascus sp. VKM F-4514 (FW-929)]|nr:hypothetical protein V495_06767 [Pseudogymnoascus sp. VKM F-4514 (FW-929)]KFY59802.1 hypothetical protein V497_04079 [Pseudogymnoascus sp. VKM F-4516 (FW-969)]